MCPNVVHCYQLGSRKCQRLSRRCQVGVGWYNRDADGVALDDADLDHEFPSYTNTNGLHLYRQRYGAKGCGAVVPVTTSQTCRSGAALKTTFYTILSLKSQPCLLAYQYSRTLRRKYSWVFNKYLTPDEDAMAAFTPDATSTVPIGPTTWKSASRRGLPVLFDGRRLQLVYSINFREQFSYTKQSEDAGCLKF